MKAINEKSLLTLNFKHVQSKRELEEERDAQALGAAIAQAESRKSLFFSPVDGSFNFRGSASKLNNKNMSNQSQLRIRNSPSRITHHTVKSIASSEPQNKYGLAQSPAQHNKTIDMRIKLNESA